MKSLFVLIIAIFFMIYGCAPLSTRMNRISLGMTKAEVIKKLGKPRSISAKGNTEYLNYLFLEDMWINYKSSFYVRLIDGKVESYGESGDFDSTQKPEQKIILDLNQ